MFVTVHKCNGGDFVYNDTIDSVEDLSIRFGTGKLYKDVWLPDNGLIYVRIVCTAFYYVVTHNDCLPYDDINTAITSAKLYYCPYLVTWNDLKGQWEYFEINCKNP